MSQLAMFIATVCSGLFIYQFTILQVTFLSISLLFFPALSLPLSPSLSLSYHLILLAIIATIYSGIFIYQFTILQVSSLFISLLLFPSLLSLSLIFPSLSNHIILILAMFIATVCFGLFICLSVCLRHSFTKLRYRVSKKTWPISYSKVLYKFGQDFLDKLW